MVWFSKFIPKQFSRWIKNIYLILYQNISNINAKFKAHYKLNFSYNFFSPSWSASSCLESLSLELQFIISFTHLTQPTSFQLLRQLVLGCCSDFPFGGVTTQNIALLRLGSVTSVVVICLDKLSNTCIKRKQFIILDIKISTKQQQL